MKLRLILLLLVLVTLAAGFAWWHLQGPVRVTAVSPQRGPAVEAVYATGTVEPVRWAQIASTETGRIVAYPASEGAAVKAGDLLVQLDDRKARAAIDELGARIAFLDGDLERYEALVQHRTVSRQVFERVKSDRDRVKALIRVARQQLADRAIRAPLDGIVLRKDGEVGEVVQAGDVLLWVGSERPYWITADVDEEDIPQVELGQRTLIKADAFPARVLDGEITEITPKGDPINKQYRVRILLPADSPLMVGMTTEVNIVTRAEEQALLVPEAALDNGAVWLVEEGRARRQPVELGVFGDALVEVRSGLSEDVRVILAPPADLEEGAAVRVQVP